VVDGQPLLVERQVLGRLDVGRQDTPLEAAEGLDDGNLHVEARLPDRPHGLAELGDEGLLPLAHDEDGLGENQER